MAGKQIQQPEVFPKIGNIVATEGGVLYRGLRKLE